MKWMAILLLLSLPADIGRIARNNRLIKEAENAFLNKNYPLAIEKYKLLIDSLQVNDDKVIMNLANAYFRNNDKENASEYYQRLLSSDDAKIKAAANQQLGLLAYDKQELPQALDYFKKSLLADPENEDARYNYELVKKLNQQQQSQDQQNKKQDPPTEFAKNAKARAEELVSQKRYKEAYDLMMNALKVDPTVGNYQDFIKRTGDVSEIDENY